MPWKSTGLSAADFPDGAMRDVLVDDRPILVIHHHGQFLAFQGRCPHEEGVLADGELASDKVVCPVHGATFALPAGTIVADPDGITPPSGDVPSLTVYPTRLLSGQLEVDVA